MDITKYKEKLKPYRMNYSIGFTGEDFTTRVALISLLSYAFKKIKEKKPTITLYELISNLGLTLSEDSKINLALICENLSYGCTEFPTFDLKGKQITDKIREILKQWTPF